MDVLVISVPPDRLGDEYEAIYRVKMGACGSFHASILVVLAGVNIDTIRGFDWKQAGLHPHTRVIKSTIHISFLTPAFLITGQSRRRTPHCGAQQGALSASRCARCALRSRRAHRALQREQPHPAGRAHRADTADASTGDLHVTKGHGAHGRLRASNGKVRLKRLWKIHI